MEIFVIYISAFSSFISSAEGKRRSRTQAKRKQHARKAQKFQELLPFQGVLDVTFPSAGDRFQGVLGNFNRTGRYFFAIPKHNEQTLL